jgi:hypothetical protein
MREVQKSSLNTEKGLFSRSLMSIVERKLAGPPISIDVYPLKSRKSLRFFVGLATLATHFDSQASSGIMLPFIRAPRHLKGETICCGR